MKERTGRPPKILLEKSVDSQEITCGDSGLVAMELGCDYGDLGSILGVT